MKILEKLEYVTNGDNLYLFHEGDKESSHFFISTEVGVSSIITGGSIVRELDPYSCFGEKALLYCSPRTATVRSSPWSKFWVLNRGFFRSTMQEISQNSFLESRQFIEKTDFFRISSPFELYKRLLDALNFVSFRAFV